MTYEKEIWGLKPVGYLFLAGVGSGAVCVAAITDLLTGVGDGLFTVTGAWIAFFCVGAGALLLLWDLGVPLRAFRLIGNRSSLISAGTVILSVLLILSALIIIINIYSIKLNVASYTSLIVITASFAIATSIYVGFLLALVKCRPFWNTPLLPLLFIVSSLSTGISATTLAGSLPLRYSLPIHIARHMASAETVMLLIELFMVTFYIIIMMNSLPQAQMGVRRLLRGDMAYSFWIGVMAIGLILPLILTSVGGSNGYYSSSASVMILMGGFFLRYCVVSAGARGLLPGETEISAFVR